jgi:hypothetical protein
LLFFSDDSLRLFVIVDRVSTTDTAQILLGKSLWVLEGFESALTAIISSMLKAFVITGWKGSKDSTDMNFPIKKNTCRVWQNNLVSL